jgi:arylsulfatase A-like enzyme
MIFRSGFGKASSPALVHGAGLALSVAGIAALLTSAACTRGGAGPFEGAPVVLVSIDTLRSDRVGCYGYAKAATPALDALAREGVLFADVFAHCPLTLPSHASLLTGLLPPAHGVRDNLGFTLDASHRTLARRFQEKGYATGGAVSAYVLRAWRASDTTTCRSRRATGSSAGPTRRPRQPRTRPLVFHFAGSWPTIAFSRPIRYGDVSSRNQTSKSHFSWPDLKRRLNHAREKFQ